MKSFLFAFTLLAALAASAAEADQPVSRPSSSRPEEVPNFALLDYHGRYHELHRTEGRVVVLFFTGNGCPIARQSMSKLRALRRQFQARGVEFWMVNTYAQDDRTSIRREAEQFGAGSIPILLDPAQGLALTLGVQRTCETIAISSKGWTVFYRGAIDDQLTEGAQKPQAATHYLASALDQFLDGQAVTLARTQTRGCRINFELSGPSGGEISYSKQIAPLLAARCVSCHSEGNLGPFAFSSHARVKNHASMIQEVVLARRMPPWHADPHYGRFANDASLTPRETQTLLRWIEQGAPRGEGEDRLEAVQVPKPGWVLGPPDAIVTLPKAEQIPATGVLDYRHIKVASPFTNDVWLAAIAFRPGNLKVVHHVILRAQYAGGHDDGSGRGTLLGGWAPGASTARFASGTGLLLGKQAVFDLEMHYTTTGSPQTDRTEIGLYLLPEKPRLALENGATYDLNLSIPPGEPDARTFALRAFKRETLLYSLTPHMHLRGSWMKYEALYPDGRRETLLSVPRYDFNWQTAYQFTEPKQVPAGTWLLCTGGFDNSARNPSNPDPTKRVRWGDQSWDEMFIGFFQASEAPAVTNFSSR